jgi:hypothetical protein
LKEEALDRTTWKTRFGRGFGPVLRQNTERMNILFINVVMGNLTYVGGPGVGRPWHRSH